MRHERELPSPFLYKLNKHAQKMADKKNSAQHPYKKRKDEKFVRDILEDKDRA